jgi:hypothetical protein
VSRLARGTARCGVGDRRPAPPGAGSAPQSYLNSSVARPVSFPRAACFERAGVRPNASLNIRGKCVWSANPAAGATSAGVAPHDCSRRAPRAPISTPGPAAPSPRDRLSVRSSSWRPCPAASSGSPSVPPPSDSCTAIVPGEHSTSPWGRSWLVQSSWSCGSEEATRSSGR